MKKALYIVFFLIASFSLNIIVYYISSDYRLFLKKIKGVEENTNTGQIASNINYDVELSNIGNTKIEKQENNKKNIEGEIKENSLVSTKNEDIESKSEYIAIPEELKITKVEERFLKIFKEYNLKKIELHPRLFDLTAEYPYDYFEYYSEYLTLYFFGNKPYSQMKDVFEVLSYEFPFSLNETNNFGDKSFYINLDDEFKDGIVRIVMQYKNRLFGLKLKKEVYEHIKTKLDSLEK